MVFYIQRGKKVGLHKKPTKDHRQTKKQTKQNKKQNKGPRYFKDFGKWWKVFVKFLNSWKLPISSEI